MIKGGRLFCSLAYFADISRNLLGTSGLVGLQSVFDLSEGKVKCLENNFEETHIAKFKLRNTALKIRYF